MTLLEKISAKYTDFTVSYNNPSKRHHAEMTFNEAGLNPGVSSFSGTTRALWLGVSSFVWDAAVAITQVALGAILYLAGKKAAATQAGKTSFQAVKYMGHDLLNIFRGFVEAIPFVGNLLVFAYNSLNLRISYGAADKAVYFTPAPIARPVARRAAAVV